MARKRYKKKRIDYRNGGRVSLKHGGRPQRGNFDNADEYRNALDNWYSDPAHRDPVASQLSPQRTTPERMSEISAMPGAPSPTGIKSVDEYNVGLSIPPEDNNLVATPTRTRTTIERGQDRKVTGGSSNTPYIPPAVTDPKDKDTRNIYSIFLKLSDILASDSLTKNMQYEWCQFNSFEIAAKKEVNSTNVKTAVVVIQKQYTVDTVILLHV